MKKKHIVTNVPPKWLSENILYWIKMSQNVKFMSFMMSQAQIRIVG